MGGLVTPPRRQVSALLTRLQLLVKLLQPLDNLRSWGTGYACREHVAARGAGAADRLGLRHEGHDRRVRRRHRLEVGQGPVK